MHIRELAAQIHSVFDSFLTSQFSVEDAYSSSDEKEEVLKHRYPSPLLLISSDESTPKQDVQRFLDTGADIVIGTPGRIEEFLLGKGKSVASVKELEILILDEADR